MFWLVASLGKTVTTAYPMFFHLEGNHQKCIEYNIPQDDDANFIMSVLPFDGIEKDESIIDYYIGEWGEMTRDGGEKMPKDAPPVSSKIESKIEDHLKSGGKRSKAGVIILVEGKPIVSVETALFKTYVFHSIVATAKEKGYESDNSLGDYQICFHNRSRQQDVSFMFESVHWDDYDDDFTIRKTKDNGVVKKHHLTPMEAQFGAALAHIAQITDEMHYAEKRSHRIYEWKTKAFSRLRYYAYFSVFVLMGTAGDRKSVV